MLPPLTEITPLDTSMSNLLKEGPRGGHVDVILIISLPCVGFMLRSVFRVIRLYGLMSSDRHNKSLYYSDRDIDEF